MKGIFEFFWMQARRGNQDECVIDQICLQLRKVQGKTGCTNKTLELIAKNLLPFFKGLEHIKTFPIKSIRRARRRIVAAGNKALKVQLHGCVGCNNHVFGPESKLKNCPLCGVSRYLNGKPQEVYDKQHAMFM